MARGLRNSVIENCEVAHVGEYGIWLRTGCINDRVIHCDVHDLGAGGIRVGDDRNTGNLRNTIDNNLVHDGAHLFHGGDAIWIGRSSENVISHNEIFDFESRGISVGWNWGYNDFDSAKRNTIECNHIHHIGHRVLSDIAGIYTLGVSPGTTMRYNLVHDILPYSAYLGGLGIYLDEGSTDILVENNIVYNIENSGFNQNVGRKDTVRNNIFAFCRGEGISCGQPEDISYDFSSNIVYLGDDTTQAWSRRWGAFDGVRADNNLYWSASGRVLRFGELDYASWQATGRDAHSVIADPLFVDPEHHDFRLLPGSPADMIGFKQIDMSSVGLYGDPQCVTAPHGIPIRSDD